MNLKYEKKAAGFNDADGGNAGNDHNRSDNDNDNNGEGDNGNGDEARRRFYLLSATAKLLYRLMQLEPGGEFDDQYQDLSVSAVECVEACLPDDAEARRQIRAISREIREHLAEHRHWELLLRLVNHHRLLPDVVRDVGVRRSSELFDKLVLSLAALDRRPARGDDAAEPDARLSRQIRHLHTVLGDAERILQKAERSLQNGQPEQSATTLLTLRRELRSCRINLPAPPPQEYSELQLPAVAPEYYAERADRRETALEFLYRVWGDYLRAGALYQTDLRGQQKTKSNPNPAPGLDRKLFEALWRYCRRHGLELSEHLPPLSRKIDKLVASADPVALRADHRAYARLLMARRRRESK